MFRRARLASDPCFELYRRSDERHQAAEFSRPGSSPLLPSLALGRLSVGNSLPAAVSLHPRLSAVPLPIPCSFALVFFGSGLSPWRQHIAPGIRPPERTCECWLFASSVEGSKVARAVLGRLICCRCPWQRGEIVLYLLATSNDVLPFCYFTRNAIRLLSCPSDGRYRSARASVSSINSPGALR